MNELNEMDENEVGKELNEQQKEIHLQSDLQIGVNEKYIEEDEEEADEETNFVEEVIFSEGDIQENFKKYLKRIKKRYICLSLYILLIIVLFLFLILMVSIYLTKSGDFELLLEFISSIGYYGNLVIVLLLIPAMVPFVPGFSILGLGSGFIYGFVLGSITVIIGCQLGTILLYFLIRFLIRAPAERFLLKKGGVKMKAFLYELNRSHFLFSFLVRFIPISVGLQTCLLSISPVPIWKIIITSFFGLLFKILPFVYIGTTARTLADIATGNVKVTYIDLIILIVGVIGLICIVIFVVILGRRTVKRMKEFQQEHSNEEKIKSEKDIEVENEIPNPYSFPPIELELEISQEISNSDPTKLT